MKFLFLIWSNLKRKKLRTILTLLSVLVAFILFSLLSALKLAFAGGVNMADANRLVVRHRVSFIQPLPHSYQARLARIPRGSAVSPQAWVGGTFPGLKKPFGSLPVDPESFLAMNPG